MSVLHGAGASGVFPELQLLHRHGDSGNKGSVLLPHCSPCGKEQSPTAQKEKRRHNREDRRAAGQCGHAGVSWLRMAPPPGTCCVSRTKRAFPTQSSAAVDLSVRVHGGRKCLQGPIRPHVYSHTQLYCDEAICSGRVPAKFMLQPESGGQRVGSVCTITEGAAPRPHQDGPQKHPTGPGENRREAWGQGSANLHSRL